jgi:hypothetical protein
MLMGGDQIYFDSIWEDISVLRQWVALPRQAQLNFKVSKSLDREIEAYYFGLYSNDGFPLRGCHGRPQSLRLMQEQRWHPCQPS